jgi:DNA-directed RNA polymerase specialized sigma24 family protein
LGFDSVDDMYASATDDAVADDLIHRLVAVGPVGVEIALGVLAPALERATGRLRAWSGEDVGELITAACWERLQNGDLPARPTRSVVAGARKKVIRQLQRSWAKAQTSLPILDHILPSTTDVEAEVVERLAETDLINWVMTTAEIDDQTARIIVHSRALGVSMDAVAAAEGLAYHTAYRRRKRAEEKIRSSVQSGHPVVSMTGV